MNKTYYLFHASELERSQNTIKVTLLADDIGEKERVRYLPVEQVEDIFVMNALRMNSALLDFLGKNGIAVHFFDYYENYTGSFFPKIQLLSGKLHVEQALTYHDYERRMNIAREFIQAGSFNMRRNLLYYKRRDVDLEGRDEAIDELRKIIPDTKTIPELMGIEGNIRQHYYETFGHIMPLMDWFSRQKRPATDPVNALISFGNAILYAKIITQVYHTQLLPTVSFLHEPGVRRFSLALDVSEIFKPIFVDRLVFRLFNKMELTADDFELVEDAYFLKDKGKKVFLNAWEEIMTTTIMHPRLKRKVSYLRLIRLELYKLVKDILQIEPYQGFKMRW